MLKCHSLLKEGGSIGAQGRMGGSIVIYICMLLSLDSAMNCVVLYVCPEYILYSIYKYICIYILFLLTKSQENSYTILQSYYRARRIEGHRIYIYIYIYILCIYIYIYINCSFNINIKLGMYTNHEVAEGKPEEVIIGCRKFEWLGENLL